MKEKNFINKLFARIGGIALAISLALGVGTGIALNNKAATKLNATATYTWQRMTSTSEFVNGAVLLITQGSYYLDASQAATGNTPRMANLVTSNGLPTMAADNSKTLTVTTFNTGLRLCKSTETTKYLYTNTSNNGTRIGNSSTNGSLWTISSAGTNEFYLMSNADRYLSRYATTDFRSYTNTNTNANLTIYKLVEAQVDPDKTIQANSITIKSGDLTISGTYEPEAPYYIGDTLNLASSVVNYEQGNDYQDGQGSISWESGDANVATVSDGMVTFVGAGTAVITATAVDKGAGNSDVSASFTLNISGATYRPGTLNNPYSVQQALALSSTNGVYVTGIVSTITEISTSYGNATYKISDDGSQSDEMIVYRGKYTNNVNFTAQHQLQLGDTVVITGNISEYNSANQLAQNNYITSLVPVDYFITYNNNGADSGSVPIDSNGYKRNVSTGNASATTKTNEGNLAKTGYSFRGWNTHADPTANGAHHYDAEEAISLSGDTTLYAEWLSIMPTIVVQSNLEGYTGENTDLSFAYGNIANTENISVVPSNDNVSVGNISANNGSGSVQISLNKAGNTTLSFRNSGDELATCSVTIAQSTVTITGLPSTRTVYAGRSTKLGNSISVESTGSYTTDVNWNSDNNQVATVDNNGLVVGVSVGTANITVTAESDENVYMTCVVTVNETPTAYFIDFGETKNTNPSAIESDDDFKEAYSFTNSNEVTVSGLEKVYGSNNTNMLKIGSNKATGSITFTIPAKYFISSLELTVDTAAGGNLTVTSGATSAETESQTIIAGTLIFDDYLESEKSNSITMASTANGAFYLTNITIFYSKTIKETINTDVLTQSLLAYHYSKDGDDPFVFSDVILRFGGFISVDLWTQLEDEYDIQGYGIMYAETNNLTSVSIKEWYELALDESGGDIDAAITSLNSFIGNSYVELTQSKTHPGIATTSQKEELGVDVGDGYYMWNHRELVPQDGLETEYSAIAYIRIDGELVFLKETSNTAKQAALDLLNNHIYEDDAFDGSLYALAHLND